MAIHLVASKHQAAQRVVHHLIDSIQGFIGTVEGTGFGQICCNQEPSDIFGSEFTHRHILNQDVAATGVVETVLKHFDTAAPTDILAYLIETVRHGAVH